MNTVKLALIGAGTMGLEVYGECVLKYSLDARFVAVAEPEDNKRNLFGDKHKITKQYRFKTYKELLSKPRFCDGLLICTQDKLHYEPAVLAMKKGYNVLVEKPLSSDIKECLEMGKLEEKYNRILMVCHVLRYTVFFSTIKKLLEENKIGSIVSIQHNENVGYWHQAHSFVRGNWRDSKKASPMILAKSCHDMDLLRWLVGEKCIKVSSFGSLSYFKKENAPKGSTDRCTDGCSVEQHCPYSAKKLYLGEATGWPVSVISLDKSLAARAKALKEGPYGRCVFRCDNNVVDHQVVNLEFENGVTACFTMCAFTKNVGRTIKIMGTLGEIRGSFEKNEIELNIFGVDKPKIINLVSKNKIIDHHGGGDRGLLEHFVKQLKSGKSGPAILPGGCQQAPKLTGGLTSAKVSVESHLMAFAAEEARLTNKVVSLLIGKEKR